MIHTAIGLETGDARLPGHNALQGWMAEHGLQPYLPQLATLRTYNLALQFDVQRRALNWPAAAVKAVLPFAHPMVWYYGKYHYAQQPRAVRWGETDQDEITAGVMTGYMRDTLRWFSDQGITRPWLFVDEPPHASGDRWVLEVDERIYKFVNAAVDAGWKVGVSCPSPFHLAYWAKRISGVRWVLNAKHGHSEWQKTLERVDSGFTVWLYNRRDGFDGLAAQMREMGATGYLHWAAEWRENPLATVDEEGFEVLPGMLALLRELAAMEAVTLEGLDERLTAVEKAVFGMRIG